jgi:hypothetical protein
MLLIRARRWEMKKLRILSWNVNGLRAARKKGFLEWLARERPDILCIQETKAAAALLLLVFFMSGIKKPRGRREIGDGER